MGASLPDIKRIVRSSAQLHKRNVKLFEIIFKGRATEADAKFVQELIKSEETIAKNLDLVIDYLRNTPVYEQWLKRNSHCKAPAHLKLGPQNK